MSFTEFIFRIEYREKNGHLLIFYMHFEQIMTITDPGNICVCITIS